MAFKIAGCAGHGGFGVTAGKRTPDGEFEWDFNNKVILAFEEALKQYEGVEFLRTDDRSGHTDVPLATRTNKANAWGADVYLSFHHNAYKGIWGTHTGTETHVWTTPGAKALALADAVQSRIVKAYGLFNRGIKKTDLHIVRETQMPAILVEGGYMDSTIDITKLRNDSVLRTAGYAAAEGVAQYAGLKKKAQTVPTPVPVPAQPATNLYRIRKTWDDIKGQIGAYSNLDSAKIEADKNPGYKVFDQNGNVVYPISAPTPTTHMYRIRLDWADAKSQIGAYAIIDSAKSEADKNKDKGYKVFDENGNLVYTPVISPEPIPPVILPEPIPIEKHDGHHSIVGQSEATKEQMTYFIQQAIIDGKITIPNNVPENIAKDFYEVGEIEGVRGDIALAQALKETGWFKYGGDVKPEQNNFCGLGATGGVPGHSFITSREGVLAQCQHLKGYATSEQLKLPLADPRYQYISPKGKAPHAEDLSGMWAVPGFDKTKYSSLELAMAANDTYGHQIMKIVKQITEVVIPIVEPEPIPENPIPVEEKVNIGLLNKVLQMVLDLLTKLFKK